MSHPNENILIMIASMMTGFMLGQLVGDSMSGRWTAAIVGIGVLIGMMITAGLCGYTSAIKNKDPPEELFKIEPGGPPCPTCGFRITRPANIANN